MNNTSANNSVFIILNVTHHCNLSCKYCYYEGEMSSKPGTMNLELIETIFKKAAESSFDEVQFCFHGGEPLTLNLDTYDAIMELQKEYLSQKSVKNAIQTNCTLNIENLIYLYNKYKFQVGLSLDGPKEVHDFHRIYKNGSGSFDAAFSGINRLIDEKIPIGILAVCSDRTSEYIEEFYNLYNSMPNIYTMDLLLPHWDGENSILSKENLTRTYTKLFDIWFNDANGQFSIRFLESIVSSLLVSRASLCSFDTNCFSNKKILSIDTEGNLAPCDNCTYINLGNINNTTFDDAVYKNLERSRYATIERKRLESCIFCEWYDLCKGGCPLNRTDSEPNYYCNELKEIFSHIKETLIKAHLYNESGALLANISNIPNPKLMEVIRKRADITSI